MGVIIVKVAVVPGARVFRRSGRSVPALFQRLANRVQEGDGGDGRLAEVSAPRGGVHTYLVHAVHFLQLVEVGKGTRSVGCDGVVPGDEGGAVPDADDAVRPDHRHGVVSVAGEAGAVDRNDLVGAVLDLVGDDRRRCGGAGDQQDAKHEDYKRNGQDDAQGPADGSGSVHGVVPLSMRVRRAAP